MLIASIAYLAVLAGMYLMIIFIETTMAVDQTWLFNLKTCGVDLDRVDGKLVPDNQMFASPELWSTAHYSALYASYIGLILFRLNGFGRVPYDYFFHRNVVQEK